MSDMTAAPAHAKRRAEGLIAAWLCLVIAGAATVTFNIVHAWRSGMASPLGIVEGVVPVALAMIVSHLVATSSAGRFLKSVTFAVMIGALALSVRATGTVVAPAAGPLWWLYGAVVDTAALVSLQVLLALKARTARLVSERAQADAAAADERTALRAQIEGAQAALAPLREALAVTEAERDEAAARAEVLAQKLARASGQKRTRKSPPKKTPASTPEVQVPEDFDTQAAALEIIAAEPGISGSELGRRLGKSERYGCMLKNQLAGSVPGPDGKS